MAVLQLPGLIDPHVHLRDPGQTEKEDFFTGTSAALAGGFTTVIDMPNNTTPITTAERLQEKVKVAREKTVSDIGFYFGSLGDNLDEFPKVSDKVFGLKLYLNQTTGNFLLDKSHLEKIFKAWPEKKPILVHAEDKTFDDVLDVVRKYPRKIHLCHMSSRYELERVIDAKNAGLPVTCGVTPHHLFLTEGDERILGPFGKMRPPLRSRGDVDFFWKHLSAIDLIESDHAPHTLPEKQSDNPPNGVTNLETTLPLLMTAVSENRLTVENIIRLCHEGPATVFAVPTDTKTYVEVDPAASYEIQNEDLFTKCKWSPFNGWKVKGRVLKVVLHGNTVFENGKLLASPGSGTILS